MANPKYVLVYDLPEPKPTEMAGHIRQRWFPCNCGCKGQDSWHHLFLDRMVRKIEWLDYRAAGADEYGFVTVARGVYKHPSGEERPCWLEGVYNSKTGDVSLARWVGAKARQAKNG